MKRTYLGAVGQGSSGFSIVFLDFPGCASCGETLEEALAMGQEALQGHIDVTLDYGEPLPAPSDHQLSDVDRWLYDDEDEERDRWIGLYPIEVDDTGDHDEVRIGLPRTLIRDIDDTIPDVRRFIIEATRRELDRLKKSA